MAEKEKDWGIVKVTKLGKGRSATKQLSFVEHNRKEFYTPIEIFQNNNIIKVEFTSVNCIILLGNTILSYTNTLYYTNNL